MSNIIVMNVPEPEEGDRGDYQITDFCLACNFPVLRADPSRGCPVCGHVSVVRAEDLTAEFRKWYQKVMDRL